MRKTWSLLIAVVFALGILGSFPVTAATRVSFGYDFLEDGTIEITNWYKNEVGNYDPIAEIPSEIDGYTVTSIGWGVFSGNESLRYATIPDTVTSIGEEAFMGCYNLTTLVVPSSVTSIGKDAFANCSWLTIYGDEGSGVAAYAEVYSIDFVVNEEEVDENVYSLDKLNDGTATIRSYTGKKYDIVIPSEIDGYKITGIWSGAFDDVSVLKSITIPEGVTRINESTFRNQSYLVDVTIPEGVTEIRRQAFYGCSSITEITLPSTVTYIDASALPIGNDNFVISGYTGSYAEFFAEEKNVEFKSLGKNPGQPIEFMYNIVDDYELGTIVTITKYVGTAETFEIPAKLSNYKVAKIGASAFENCTTLTSVTIPNTVINIDVTAFDGCDLTINGYDGSYAETYVKGLAVQGKSISFKSLGTPPVLPEDVYGYRDNYSNGVRITSYTGTETDIVIPSDLDGYPVTFIEGDAFRGNTELKSVVIPDTVTTIDYYAFSGCTSLTSVTIGRGVTTIEREAFYECDNLTTISGYTNSYAEIFAQQQGLTFVSIGNLPDTEATVSDLIYEVLDDGTIEIIDITRSANIVVIPSEIDGYKVTMIDEYVFRGDVLLKSVTIPEGVDEIDRYAFEGCVNLTISGYTGSYGETFAKISNIPFVSLGEASGIPNGEYKYEILEDGTLSITLYRGVAANLEIPSTLGEYTVTRIDDAAFSNNMDARDKLRAVTIPETVTTIGKGAFYMCYSLKQITIPSSVTEIGEEAFYPGLTIYGELKSYAETYAKFYDIPFLSLDEKTELSDYEYYLDPRENTAEITGYIGADTVIEVPNRIDGHKVTKIGGGVFKDNTQIESVTIPSTITEIGTYAFERCYSLTSVTIGNGVETIDEYAFTNCTSLTSITIPRNVSKISSNAFEGCNNVTILGYDGSYAEEFATFLKIPFESLGTAPTTTEPTTEPTEPDPTVPTTEPTDPTEPEITLLGDVDLDGDVDYDDLDLLWQHSVGENLLTGQARINSDFNGNGTVDSDADDWLRLKEYLDSQEPAVVGDLDGDNEIGITDIVTVAKILHKQVPLTEETLAAADLNTDNIVNAIDLVIIKYLLLKR
jgi:hypothetical protein